MSLEAGSLTLEPKTEALNPGIDVAPTPTDSRLPGAGCYVVAYSTYASDGAMFLCGTLRIEPANGAFCVSGDLYDRKILDSNEPAPLPDPAAGIPIFPIGDYGFYLRGSGVSETEDGFLFSFDAFRFVPAAMTKFSGRGTFWSQDGSYSALMVPASAAEGEAPIRNSYLGEVKDADGNALGSLSMTWAAPYFRKATIEIDRVPASEVPLGNGMGVTWRSIFDKVDWDLDVLVSESDIPEPSGPSWSSTEAHGALHARRDQSDLDSEWRYHILAVQQIDFASGPRGYMYDETIRWPNRLPREGLMVASHYAFSNEDRWGLVKGLRSGTTVTYFRTAVHELGHALGLDHSDMENSFMVPTDTIANNAKATPATPFPMNINWAYSRDDEHRLRHWPDLVVRPGGLNVGAGKSAPIPPRG